MNTSDLKINLRSQPVSNLSFEQVERMLKRRDLYDRSLNDSGKGVRHQYEVLEAGLIVDHKTGLMWQRDGSSDDLTYDEAKKHIQNMNFQSVGGFKDWRLPTLEEAMSLMEIEDKKGGLYIDPVFSEERTDVRYIWTSDLSNFGTGWYVCLPDGFCMSDEFPAVTNRVRAVRQLAPETLEKKTSEKAGCFSSIGGVFLSGIILIMALIY